MVATNLAGSIQRAQKSNMRRILNAAMAPAHSVAAILTRALALSLEGCSSSYLATLALQRQVASENGHEPQNQYKNAGGA